MAPEAGVTQEFFPEGRLSIDGCRRISWKCLPTMPMPSPIWAGMRPVRLVSMLSEARWKPARFLLSMTEAATDPAATRK